MVACKEEVQVKFSVAVSKKNSVVLSLEKINGVDHG
jgi:hypothetical protein